jgi:hypothetical protein
MKLTFLGTRGEIETRTRRHRMHTSLMVSYHGADVMINFGRLGRKIRATAPAKIGEGQQLSLEWSSH